MKYKLIKEYPGSPKLGKIIETQTYSIYPFKEIYNVIDYPEFWEEILEKNYEILLYKDFSNNYKVTPLAKPYHNGNWEIYQIKRLSDGEIFTIGDSIRESILVNVGGWKIKEFSLKDTRCFSCGVNINYIQKIKNPFFTTEDGVDIFEGDEYFEVMTPDFHNKPCIWNILSNKTRNNINYDQKSNKEHGRIWFSTKKKLKNIFY